MEMLIKRETKNALDLRPSHCAEEECQDEMFPWGMRWATEAWIYQVYHGFGDEFTRKNSLGPRWMCTSSYISKLPTYFDVVEDD